MKNQNNLSIGLDAIPLLNRLKFYCWSPRKLKHPRLKIDPIANLCRVNKLFGSTFQEKRGKLLFIAKITSHEKQEIDDINWDLISISHGNVILYSVFIFKRNIAQDISFMCPFNSFFFFILLYTRHKISCDYMKI